MFGNIDITDIYYIIGKCNNQQVFLTLYSKLKRTNSLVQTKN